ncbi:MAG TPA: tRNA (adenosine(37)-N6)-threonylcarbamoyltransferase complex ATPase subunit type 1 TsaE [Candidatus Bipolaricaulota bacterium]|nr:tRNA (adenosine(37)-N6)-threonylcarbamoyltransferase complex ATPase subunit type 1 TsaE [Candidatus Bipolaricaulota bacterium]
MENIYAVKTEAQTKKIAGDFAKTLKGGEVILLSGDLGAGKTFFVQAAAKALGVKEQVTSPTFILMQIYKASRNKIKNVCHIDAYRLGCVKEFEASGLDECLYRDDTVSFIEWGEKVKTLMRGAIEINIEIKENERVITIDKN